MLKHRSLFFALSALIMAPHAGAKIVTKKMDYLSGGQTMEGVLVYDDAIKGPRPGVLVAHNWMGVTQETIDKATLVAKLGHAAFAMDVYGKGIRPTTTQAASELAAKYRGGDRADLKARTHDALEFFKKLPQVNPQKLAAIGYCFGGTTVLEMARSGEPLLGVVSLHGGLTSVRPEDAQKITGKVLVLHGAIDPFVKPEEVAQFQKEMNEAKVNYELAQYSGAVHSFTEKGAGDDVSKGAAYNAQADARSFLAMKNFFKEIF